MQVPCGQCPDCRASQTLQGGTRAFAETFGRASCFLTLTLSDEHLWAPMGRPSLFPPDLQKFHKKLRRAGHKFRYYACGEYGDLTDRPHYHGIYAGYWPSDAVRHGSHEGNPSYKSESLARIWGKGNVLVQEVTLGSASYVAGYVGKKLFGRLGAEHYSDRFPPFVLQSQSLGRDFFEKYIGDCINNRLVVPNADGSARPVGVPRAWVTRLKRLSELPLLKNGDYAFHAMQLELLKASRAAARPAPEPDYYVQYRHETAHEAITLSKRNLYRGKL